MCELSMPSVKLMAWYVPAFSSQDGNSGLWSSRTCWGHRPDVSLDATVEAKSVLVSWFTTFPIVDNAAWYGLNTPDHIYGRSMVCVVCNGSNMVFFWDHFTVFCKLQVFISTPPSSVFPNHIQTTASVQQCFINTSAGNVLQPRTSSINTPSNGLSSTQKVITEPISNH